MKKALAIERRLEKKIEEKKSLLKNQEKERHLKIDQQDKTPEILLSMDHVDIKIEDKYIFRDFSLRVEKKDRIAIMGANGSGKTTLFNAIAGDLPICGGTTAMPGFITLFRSYQIPLWTEGYLRGYLEREKID